MHKKLNNKYFFKVTKSFKKFGGVFYPLRGVVQQLRKKQYEDEVNYRDMLLGFGKYVQIFKNNTYKQRDIKARDLVYGYLYEEDIRIRLAHELIYEYPESYVHGQILINKHNNRKGNSSKVKDNHMFPDLVFTILRQKERYVAADNHIQSNAIEIKYFSMSEKESRIKDAIIKDVKKLVSYTGKRVSFRMDTGLFFCIDESGKAEKILRNLLENRKFKNQPLGYACIVPEYALKNYTYPRIFEKFEQGKERNLAFILDLVMTWLYQERYIRKPDVEKRENVVYCTVHNNVGKYYGDVNLVFHEHIPKRKKGCAAVMVYLSSLCRHILDGNQFYKFEDGKYVCSEKDTDYALVGYVKLKLDDYDALEYEAYKLYNRLKPIIKLAKKESLNK